MTKPDQDEPRTPQEFLLWLQSIQLPPGAGTDYISYQDPKFILRKYLSSHETD